jgi:hypothetical protein
VAVDWNAIATIASPVLGVVAGIFGNRWFENRPKLLAWYSHVGTHGFTPQGGPSIPVYTHAIVLRSAGRQPATNIRVMHRELPDFRVHPPVAYTVENTPGGSHDVLIPRLVPGEELTLSYLYFPPLTAGSVHAGIKCDSGWATAIPVLLSRQPPRWARRCLLALTVIGVITVIYGVWHGAIWLSQKLG